ncbi:hypothetical protein Tco_0257221 [Tanacetum coccineum]
MYSTTMMWNSNTMYVNSNQQYYQKLSGTVMKEITEAKYTTSITKHYAARYYKEGIKDMISERWSKEVRRYHFEALNGDRYDKSMNSAKTDSTRLSVN